MTFVDLWATGAISVAGVAIAIRARMLRPRQRAWTEAPALVWVPLTALGFGALMAAVDLVCGGHATAREAMVDTLLAVAGVAMLLNLNRHGRAETVRRTRFAADVRQVLDLTPEPARYPWERGR